MVKFAEVTLILAACFLESVQDRDLIAQLGPSGAQMWKRSMPALGKAFGDFK